MELIGSMEQQKQGAKTQWANMVSVGRVGLALFALGLILDWSSARYYSELAPAWAFTASAILTAIVIWLDGVDGYIARKLGECSTAGAVIDIAGDRVVELLYWLAFALLGWLPAWVPALVIMRGVAVDAARGMALTQGKTAFGAQSMQKSKLGIWLTSSRASRWLYAVAKALAFVLLIVAHHPASHPAGPLGWVYITAQVSVYVSVVFCVLRAIPVLAEARRYS